MELPAIVKRRKRYEDIVQCEYEVDDIIGLKINNVDDSNFISEMLPCKIIAVHSTSENIDTYQLCTAICKISSTFQASDLLCLPYSNFLNVSDTYPATLPIRTFGQTSNAHITPTSDCETNKIQSGTIFHSSGGNS